MVAESGEALVWEVTVGIGRGRGDGMANILDARRRAPPGDVVREAIVSRSSAASSEELGHRAGSAREVRRLVSNM